VLQTSKITNINRSSWFIWCSNDRDIWFCHIFMDSNML